METLSELGVLFLLYEQGLELSLDRLKVCARPVVQQAPCPHPPTIPLPPPLSPAHTAAPPITPTHPSPLPQHDALSLILRAAVLC